MDLHLTSEDKMSKRIYEVTHKYPDGHVNTYDYTPRSETPEGIDDEIEHSITKGADTSWLLGHQFTWKPKEDEPMPTGTPD